MKPTKSQQAKFEALLDEAKCPECMGQKTTRITNMDTDPPDAWVEDCPTCKGTGNRYEIALVDFEAKLHSFITDSPSYRTEDFRDGVDACKDAYRLGNFHKVVKRL